MKNINAQQASEQRVPPNRQLPRRHALHRPPGTASQHAMKREVSIEEIRRFFDTANAQFEEAEIYLLRVKFQRSEDGTLTGIVMDYENHREDKQKETEH